MLTLKEETMLGNIPSDWNSKPLKVLLKEHYPGNWGEERGPYMVKVLRSTNLTNDGRLDLSDVAKRALKPNVAALLEPYKGDILLERSGGGPDQPVGRVGFIESLMLNHAFSNFLHLLRPDPHYINPRYLGWVLWRINQTRRILRLEQQTTQMRNLNFRDYLLMPLPVPPLEEQVAIAEILDSVDTAIERTCEAVERARTLQTSLLTHAFERMRAERRRIGEFATDVRYGTSQAAHERGWGIPTLRIPNVVGDQLTLDDLAYVDLKPAEVKRLALRDEDLLLVRTNGNPNYVGRSAVFKVPDDRVWVYASYLIRVRLTDELMPDYVNIFLGLEHGRRELLRRVTTSAGNHNINSNSIRLISIPVPHSKDEQHRIINIARTCREHIAAMRQKVTALLALKHSLMHDLLTGKVRVKKPTHQLAEEL
jgi:type I restriction enzyme S subunit